MYLYAYFWYLIMSFFDGPNILKRNLFWDLQIILTNEAILKMYAPLAHFFKMSM